MFCKEKKYVLEELTSKEELAIVIKDWAFNMKRKDGEDYQESVKIMYNSTAKQLQEMYYQKFNVKCNPFANFELSGARAARDSKRRNLQANATKKKVSSFALTTEELFKVVSIWDENTLKVCHESCFTLSETKLAKQIAAVYSTFWKNKIIWV
ncbi:hypothetical protein ILUMI_01516 [Ignelater luminosus]|uniref:Uncharacterized protein n=1 Tax=Ignelater luminosus TaxID=2038154 RepID=A0A8K0DI70_IGNLU|nr:hypothetical protein ILUMI_01516 [Ignelater luminosus]